MVLIQTHPPRAPPIAHYTFSDLLPEFSLILKLFFAERDFDVTQEPAQRAPRQLN